MPRRAIVVGVRPGPRLHFLKSPTLFGTLLFILFLILWIMYIAEHKSPCNGPYSSPHEILFLSYPKSGRTWLRFLVGKAIYHAYLPKTEYMTLDDILLGRFPKGVLNITYAFAHACDELHKHPFTLTKAEALQDDSYRGQNVVLLVRDPRDVVLSAWHEARYRFHPRRRVRDMSFEDFVLSPRGGYRTILGYYQNWAHNVSRLARRYKEVKYENLKAHPAVYLGEVIKFMGLKHKVKKEDIAYAVEHASFERMQELERSGAFTIDKMKPYDRKNPDSYKIRKGEIGEWQKYLTDRISKVFAKEKCHCRWYK